MSNVVIQVEGLLYVGTTFSAGVALLDFQGPPAPATPPTSGWCSSPTGSRSSIGKTCGARLGWLRLQLPEIWAG